MTGPKSRFAKLAVAVAVGADEIADVPLRPGAGAHRPRTAIVAVGETLRSNVARLEAELAQATTENADLVTQLERARALSVRAGAEIEEFVYLDATSVIDLLPKDRLFGRTEGPKFEELFSAIGADGQNDAITVRRGAADATYEIAAGRRRLEVCRRLKRPVLARLRDLDDGAMLRIQYSENEQRLDISALERARWFAAVKDQTGARAKDVAARFGVDPSTLSLYLRLARFPDVIIDRLEEPQRLAVLPARRVMEAIDTDATTVQRICDALDAHSRTSQDTGAFDYPVRQIEVLIDAAAGRTGTRAGARSPVPDRRHIVHQGRRVGTLTRNGRQWVFRFATSISDSEVRLLAERLAPPVSDDEDVGEGETN
jgi:ParB family chromosome partitioning protein